jgi:hypothetical protein
MCSSASYADLVDMPPYGGAALVVGLGTVASIGIIMGL